MINIYGTGEWAKKITQLLPKGDYAQYDSTDYDQAPADMPWVIALEDGNDRLTVADTVLNGSLFHTLFDGCKTLDGSVIGKGLVVGCCSLVRPGTRIGDQVYIGANSVIDINCTIEDGVTIGDNVTVYEGVTIPANTEVPSGSVVKNS
jgi:NDP-sugar pyrophosphorylase family protein